MQEQKENAENLSYDSDCPVKVKGKVFSMLFY